MSPLSKETIDGILELAGGEEFILVELFQSFLEDAEELSNGIKTAADNADWKKLKFDVHTLKGLCGTIGANPLFEVCKVLNDDLKNENTATAIALANDVVSKYEELVEYIKANYQV